MKKILGIVVLGLLWSNLAFSYVKLGKDKIVVSTDEFVIIKFYDGNPKLIDTHINGGDYWSDLNDEWELLTNFKNIKLPILAESHCKKLNKNTYWLGQGDENFYKGINDGRNVQMDWYYKTSVINSYTLVRFFCANSHKEALKNFSKTIGVTKFQGLKKFESMLEKKGVDLFNSQDLIWVSNDNKAKTILSSRIKTVDEYNKKVELKNNKKEADKESKEKKDKEIKISKMIEESKIACRLSGLEEGTDKFIDCTIKLYSQKVELAAEKKQMIISSGTLLSSESNSVTIYDPVRDNKALIKRGQGLLTGSCTVANLSNC